MTTSLDVDKILTRFADGSLTEMSRLLTDRGFPITKQGVSRWRTQRMLPMQAWLELCSLERAQGRKAPDLRRFVVWGRR